MTVEWIIKFQGSLLDEEWDIIYSIIRKFASNNAWKGPKSGREILKNIFSILCGLYINGDFKGEKEQLMEIFSEVKDIINDTSFDSIYIYNLMNYPADYIEEKLKDIMNLANIIHLRDSKDSKDDYDNRMSEILNAFEGLLKDSHNYEIKEMLENLFIQKAIEYSVINLTVDNSVKVLKLLYEMASETQNNDHFSKITEIFVRTIVRLENSQMTSMKVYGVPLPKLKYKSFTHNTSEIILLATTAHKFLFELFHKAYLLYPPFRLMTVLNSLISTLETNIKEIKLLTLNFLAGLSYDHNYLLCLWKVPSYLSGLDTYLFNFPAQTLVNAMTNFFNLDLDIECVLQALDVLISLCQCHYGLRNVKISKLIEDLSLFGNQAAQRKEADVGLKIITVIQLVVMQKNWQNDKVGKQIVELSLKDLITCFTSCHNELMIIAGFFRTEIEEFKKSKQYKKVFNMPTHCKLSLYYF